MKKVILLSFGFFLFINNTLAYINGCTEDHTPVCGADYITYKNSCYAEAFISPIYPNKIKYEGECMPKNTEKTIKDAWVGFNNNYIKVYDQNIQASLYEEMLGKIGDIKVKTSNSLKISMYNYFESLIVTDLNNVYLGYISDNLDNIIKTKAIRGKWNIVSLDRVSKNEINFFCTGGKGILVTIYIGVEDDLIFAKSIFEELLN